MFAQGSDAYYSTHTTQSNDPSRCVSSGNQAYRLAQAGVGGVCRLVKRSVDKGQQAVCHTALPV